MIAGVSMDSLKNREKWDFIKEIYMELVNCKHAPVQMKSWLNVSVLNYSIVGSVNGLHHPCFHSSIVCILHAVL